MNGFPRNKSNVKEVFNKEIHSHLVLETELLYLVTNEGRFCQDLLKLPLAKEDVDFKASSMPTKGVFMCVGGWVRGGGLV